jgi:hypothetical protein
MLPWILLALGALIVIFVVIVALQPAEFRIARSAMIAAPPAATFAQVNDFHNWQHWSPWEKLDPTMKKTYEGAPSGSGAIYSWSGNSTAGEGRMTLLESHPSDLIRIKLEFLRPFKATNAAEFTFKPEGDRTLVTWSITGQKNFIFKAVHLFMNMDKMLGGEFEKGLTQMKSIVEGSTGR